MIYKLLRFLFISPPPPHPRCSEKRGTMNQKNAALQPYSLCQAELVLGIRLLVNIRRTTPHDGDPSRYIETYLLL